MRIIPAIDIKGGNVVRLRQGVMTDETVYDSEPWNVARTWENGGAEMLHLVDLDGAFEGRGVNDDAVRRIVESTDMFVELGGGIRDMRRIDTLLDLGIDQVILGTVAVESPDVVQAALDRHGPERVCVGIDARDGMAATRGWTEKGGRPAVELALDMKSLGVTRIIYTDISRDGMLTGPNVEETRRIAEKTGLSVTASGGMSSLDDIRALKEIESSGVDAVILGKALYEGTIGLRDALETAEN